LFGLNLYLHTNRYYQTFEIWLLGSDLIGIVGIRKIFLAFSVAYP